MPIVIPKDIPAAKILQKENVFVMTSERAKVQDVRPIEILILNLMPTKEVTETQLLRLLSNSPLQINLTLLTTETYTGKNTPQTHMKKFYKSFSEVKDKKFDGMIITGAPVEKMEFSDVLYWEELKRIFDFAKTNVTSTIFICWGAQAALKYFYGIEKKLLSEKLFGIYKTKKLVEYEPLLKGIDDRFDVPHSRYTTVTEESIINNDQLELLASSKKAGATIAKSKDGKFIFLFGHMEYDRETLKLEYERDISRGLTTKIPENYFYEDDPDNEILMRWTATANLVYVNWLNYYVYQVTPYNL